MQLCSMHIIGEMTYVFRGSASSIEREQCPLQFKCCVRITWANRIIVQVYPPGTPTEQISCLSEAQHHREQVLYAYLHKAAKSSINPSNSWQFSSVPENHCDKIGQSMKLSPGLSRRRILQNALAKAPLTGHNIVSCHEFDAVEFR